MIKLNGKIVELNKYPDGTLLMKQPIEIHDNFVEWFYENDSELFALYCLAKHIHSHKAVASLKMKYVPNARMDRVKNPEDVFTLKYFSEIINMCAFKTVTILDPHSEATIENIYNLNVCGIDAYISRILSIFRKNHENNVVIYCPDENAYKKYSSIVDDLPSCYGVKRRSWETGEIIGLDVELNGVNIKDKTILMIDDIISYGGSMYYGAKKLKELNCGNIYIYATHVENSVLDGKLIQSGLFKKIYTTDSLFRGSHELIQVL